MYLMKDSRSVPSQRVRYRNVSALNQTAFRLRTPGTLDAITAALVANFDRLPCERWEPARFKPRPPS